MIIDVSPDLGRMGGKIPDNEETIVHGASVHCL